MLLSTLHIFGSSVRSVPKYGKSPPGPKGDKPETAAFRFYIITLTGETWFKADLPTKILAYLLL